MNKRIFKKEKGITLIALIITIIILMILAMVSISLVVNSGIITKAKHGVDTYTDEDITEQMKLAYAEYQMGRFSGDASGIETRLKGIFGNDNVSDVSISAGKLTATINGKKYEYDSGTGAGGEWKDPINYGEYTKETIPAGADITIKTEKFKVISNSNGEIKAMPYYNLVEVTAGGSVKQGPAVQGTSIEILSQFSTGSYWTLGTDEIDVSDPRNLIKDYINSYKTTLEELGVKGINVRAAKYSELSASEIDRYWRNPSQSGEFWLSSSNSTSQHWVYYVNHSGNLEANSWTANFVRFAPDCSYFLI